LFGIFILVLYFESEGITKQVISIYELKVIISSVGIGNGHYRNHFQCIIIPDNTVDLEFQIDLVGSQFQVEFPQLIICIYFMVDA